MYQHIMKSKEVREFFKDCGVIINKSQSAHNVVCFQNIATGEQIKLLAESDSSVAAGIPGIFYDTDEF